MSTFWPSWHPLYRYYPIVLHVACTRRSNEGVRIKKQTRRIFVFLYRIHTTYRNIFWLEFSTLDSLLSIRNWHQVTCFSTFRCFLKRLERTILEACGSHAAKVLLLFLLLGFLILELLVSLRCETRQTCQIQNTPSIFWVEH